MENLRISTMTQVATISTSIVLETLFQGLPIGPNISYIAHGYITKGDLKKKKKKVANDNRKHYFFNQVTLHIVLDKVINMKVFNNGGIQMTGLKSEGQGQRAIQTFLSEASKIPNISEIFVDTIIPTIVRKKMVMINSDFDIGFHIDREVLHREIIRQGYYSSYEPVIYPGVNIKYYHNTNQTNGICVCEGACDGKGHEGFCKKITVAVFKSGKIIITGGQSTGHILKAYEFITEFIGERKELIEIK